jgi:sterol desaturase/sphingolipid hydroxylase (fatty acid hydroxylase superfamily)
MMQFMSDLFGNAQGWLFQDIVQPGIFLLGLGAYTEEAFEGTEWFLIGVCELALLFAVLRPLEAWFPVQPIGAANARWNDFLYTALHRLGLFPILIFFTLNPLIDGVAGMLRFDNIHPLSLDSVVPDLGPVASFVLYLLVLDFFDYWYHRAAHTYHWWWGLHSLHHSQQDMNLWSDNRNHLLDDAMRDIYMAVIALGIGVPPAQYVLLVSVSRMLQSLQHANIRLHFGAIGERLLVSPRYHRMHHAIDVSADLALHGKRFATGCNFAVLFPVWDILFRSANFRPEFVATGLHDQLPQKNDTGVIVPGRCYGRGFWRQQWLGLARMVGDKARA